MRLHPHLIRTARHRAGMTQREAAERCRVSLPTYSQAEQGRDVWAATGRKICQSMGLVLAETVAPEAPESETV